MKRIAPLLLTACIVAGCSTLNPNANLPVDTPVTLQPAQRIVLPNGNTLIYEGTFNDSRCKPDVVCVWAGKAEVRFSYAESPLQIEIPQSQSATVGRYVLHVRHVPFTVNPPVTIELTSP